MKTSSPNLPVLAARCNTASRSKSCSIWESSCQGWFSSHCWIALRWITGQAASRTTGALAIGRDAW